MSRYNTQVLSSIRMLCRMQNIDEKVLYERAKLILSIYREVCWSTIDRANDVCDTLICTYGDSLDGALIYLENFAPDEARERFEERIRSLFETKWIIELVDMAMASTYGLPEMARMLGVHRQTIYYIVANEDFELIKVGRYKRATKESFEKWYHNQTRYQLAEDRQERS